MCLLHCRRYLFASQKKTSHIYWPLMCNKKKFKSHFVYGNRLVLGTTAKTIGDIKTKMYGQFYAKLEFVACSGASDIMRKIEMHT